MLLVFTISDSRSKAKSYPRSDLLYDSRIKSRVSPACRKNSDQFLASKEISEFKRRRLRGVRTVRAIVSDACPKVAANRARRGLGGIGNAHGVAPLQDCTFGFEGKHNDLAGTHELGQFAEKGARGMHGIEAFGLFAREAQRFDRDDLKSGLLNTGQNFSSEAAAHGVRLDDCK